MVKETMPSREQKHLVSKLVTLFPGGDPGYFESCLSFYNSNHVERIAEKIFTNGGIYPLVPSGIAPRSTERMNQALHVLATELFPDCDLGYLREKVLRYTHSHIEQVANQILSNRLIPERLESGKIERSDFFRSETYKVQAEAQLVHEFPQVWKSSIRAVLAENNWDYLHSRDQLTAIGSGGLWKSIRNFVMHWSLPRRGSSSTLGISGRPMDKDLAKELDGLHREKLELQRLEDEKFAQKLNEDEYTTCDQRIACQCCYDDCTFENLCFCSQGEHAFCKECVGRFMSEGLFGQGNLRGSSRIACISSTECVGCLPSRALEHFLTPDLWKAYEKSILEENVKQQSWALVQCASCSYCEVDESARPLNSVFKAYGPWKSHVRWMTMVATCLSAFYSPFLFILFFSFQWVIVPRWDARADLTTAYDRVLASRRGMVFQCRNPDCQKRTCLGCLRPVRGFHTCWEKEQDGLRLYVEKAMADAVKRTCPRCNISFQKSDGCNKIVCQCGYAMCYVCRKDIGKESYAHFCDHFRVVPGKPCDQCSKCDLYKTDPEEESVRIAAAKARRQYLYAHPQVSGQVVPNNIVIGPLTALDKLDRWRREALLWMLQFGLGFLV